MNAAAVLKNPAINAALALESGAVFYGTSFGAAGTATGEIVFNTAMSGYQQSFTDPSYHRQLIVITYPELGNYGMVPGEDEADRPYLHGVIARHYNPYVGLRKEVISLSPWLEKHGVVAVEGIDTRQLTRLIRDRGCQRALLVACPKRTSIRTSVDEAARHLDQQRLLEEVRRIPSLEGRDLAAEVSTPIPYSFGEEILFKSAGAAVVPNAPSTDQPRFRVAVLDFGVKKSILRLLAKAGMYGTVFPAKTTAAELLAFKPQGVLLSNGPGNPLCSPYAVDTVRALRGKVPLFGICYGYQILSLAYDAKIYKLPFGHRGVNHPIRNFFTGDAESNNRKIDLTSQNHGYAVEELSLEAGLSQVNLNDQTAAGLWRPKDFAFGVQYHPEAAPGPHDSAYLFGFFHRFIQKFQRLKKTTA